MSTSPQYAAGPLLGAATISTANTNRDGTGTMSTVLTAGALGSLVDDIDITAQGTTTAGMVRLFIHDGTTARLWREVPVTPNTVSASNPAFFFRLTGLDLILKNGTSLRASTENAEAFNVNVSNGGDL